MSIYPPPFFNFPSLRCIPRFSILKDESYGESSVEAATETAETVLDELHLLVAAAESEGGVGLLESFEHFDRRGQVLLLPLLLLLLVLVLALLLYCYYPYYYCFHYYRCCYYYYFLYYYYYFLQRQKHRCTNVYLGVSCHECYIRTDGHTDQRYKHDFITL